MHRAYVKIGVQDDSIKDTGTVGDVFSPTLPKMPFNALKNFCLAYCKFIVNDLDEQIKTLRLCSIKIIFKYV